MLCCTAQPSRPLNANVYTCAPARLAQSSSYAPEPQKRAMTPTLLYPYPPIFDVCYRTYCERQLHTKEMSPGDANNTPNPPISGRVQRKPTPLWSDGQHQASWVIISHHIPSTNPPPERLKIGSPNPQEYRSVYRLAPHCRVYICGCASSLDHRQTST